MYSTFFYPQTTIKWWVNCSYTYCHWKLEMKKNPIIFFILYSISHKWHYPPELCQKIFQAAAAAAPISADAAAIFRWLHLQRKLLLSSHQWDVITTIMIINVSIIITIIIVSFSRTWGNTQWKRDCPRYVAPLLSLSEYNVISFKMDFLKTYLNVFFGIETKYGVSMQCWNI